MPGQKGTLKTWNEAKGFGFIKPNDGSPDIFVHITDLKERAIRPGIGATLTYQITQDDRGRLRAYNVSAPLSLDTLVLPPISDTKSWQSGKLRTWDDKKGFGFIRPSIGGEDVFIHISDFKHDNYRPLAGGTIHYRLKKNNSGKSKACDAIMAHADFKVVKNKVALLIWLLILTPFLLSLATFYILHAILPLLIYLIMSAFAIVVYAVDKKKAKAGEWRTTESFLHLIELLGGWPGALFAQHKIRHKNNKTSYQTVFWIIVILHLGSWSYYFLAQFTGLNLEDLFRWNQIS